MSEQILESTKIEKLIAEARNYCDFIESFECDDPAQFLFECKLQLLALYHAGLLASTLPMIETSDKEFDVTVSKEDREHILKLIAHRMPFQYYWITLEAFNFDEQRHGMGDVIDDLLDIYLDAKNTLLLWDIDDIDAKKEAVWQINFKFKGHWAVHCIDALYAIEHYSEIS